LDVGVDSVNEGDMMSAVVVGPDTVEIQEAPIPKPGDGFLIKVNACGVCGSDRRQVKSASTDVEKIIGHEVTGEIVDSPKGLESWTGEPVGLAPRISCGLCRPCRLGRTNLCENVRTVGYQIPGGFAQFLQIPREAAERGNLFRLPTGLDTFVATLAEPLSCVVNGANLSGVAADRSVMVVGAGPMGQMFVMLSRIMGAIPYVLEPDEARRDFASKHGAEACFASEEDLPQCDIWIIACSSPSAYRTALESTPRGGVVNLFGGLPSGFMIDSNRIHYRELTVHGTSGSTPEQFGHALEILSREVRFSEIVTDVISFEELPNVLRGEQGGGLELKQVLDPWLD
jgi:L-iditol 2-dehydrogenase